MDTLVVPGLQAGNIPGRQLIYQKSQMRRVPPSAL